MKKNTTLLLGELLAITWVPFILSHPVFDPLIGPYQVLSLLVRVNLGVMAVKAYFTFPKAPWSLTIRLFNVISRTLIEEVFPLYKDAVGVF